MLSKSAAILAHFLSNNYSVDEDKLPVYIYGIELLLSTSFGIISILMISLLLKCLIYGIIFLIVFMSLRSFSGGYHAKTYGRCFILTNLIFIITLLAVKMSVSFSAQKQCMCILFVATFASAVIICFAPIRNQNHPISESRYLLNKKRCRHISLCYIFISILVIIFKGNLQIASVISFTLAAVAALIILAIIKERRS